MKERMTPSPHDPNKLGYFTCYNSFSKRSKNASFSKSSKKLSSDCFLKFENIKLELLVIVNKNVTVNLFLGLVHTARHAMEIQNV